VDDLIGSLLGRADVAAARSWLEAHDEATVETQLAVTAIPAPTGDEVQRGAWVANRFTDVGLEEVHVDAVGNVWGCYGIGSGAGIVIAAHLDTVFDNRAVRVQKDGPRVSAPGIGDNGRGLAAMLSLAEALIECGVETRRPITFVATVGEEGQGDLRGAKHLFADRTFRPDVFIALDGPGVDRIVHRATGSRRLRATWTGPGGHSWAAYGVANPAHAAGTAVAAISAMSLPSEPRASLSVVRLGGGQAINTIPVEAWIEIDLRAEDESVLEALDADVGIVLKRSVESENQRRLAGTAPLQLRIEPLGSRPSGATSVEHPLIQACVAATRAVGATPTLAAASTDANIPISLGIPAVARGAGGRGGDAHLLTEWYENVNGPAGIVRALLVALAVQADEQASG